MPKVNFPTSADATRPRQEVQILDVYSAENPSYGKNGLWITLKNLRTNNERQAFFPEPPSAKTTALLKALEKLGISPKDLEEEWEGLIGFKLAWVQDTVAVKRYERDDDGKRVDNADGTPRFVESNVQVEYPIEIMERPGKAASKTPRSQRPAASDNGSKEAATDEWQSLTDKVMELIDGKTLGSLKFSARNTPEIKANAEFASALVKGEITNKLVSDGLVTEDEDGVFHISL